jgi:hypothetical protein
MHRMMGQNCSPNGADFVKNAFKLSLLTTLGLKNVKFIRINGLPENAIFFEGGLTNKYIPLPGRAERLSANLPTRQIVPLFPRSPVSGYPRRYAILVPHFTLRLVPPHCFLGINE